MEETKIKVRWRDRGGGKGQGPYVKMWPGAPINLKMALQPAAAIFDDSKEWQTQVFFHVVDSVVGEMKRRFLDH